MCKILVVDDEVDLLEVIKIFLVRKNFVVEAIPKWENISTSIQSFKPDLILLDISLKGADGRIICQQLKKIKRLRIYPYYYFLQILE